MITLLGFALMVFSLLLVTVFCPDLETPLASIFYWTYISTKGYCNHISV